MAKKKVTAEEMNSVFENYEGDASGFEGVNQDTVAIPFLRILQDLSPQMKKQKAEFIPEAEAGMLFNNVSETLYESPVRFVVGKFERYYVEWKPNRGGFVASHLPEDIENPERAQQLMRDEKNRLVDPRTGNLFMDTYTYYILLPDYMEAGVRILALSSTQLKEARKLNRNMSSTMIPGSKKRALPFFLVWNLETVPNSNDQGDWMGLKISFNSFVDQAQLDYVKEERLALPNKPLDLKQLEGPSTDTETQKY